MVNSNGHSRRSFLKTAASAGVLAGLANPTFVSPAAAASISGPYRDGDISESPHWRHDTAHISIASGIDWKGAIYNEVDGVWQHEFYTTLSGASVAEDESESYTVTSQWLDVQESDIDSPDIEDIRPGSNPEENGLYPASGSTPDWPQAFYTVGSYAVAALSGTAGKLLTAASIIDALVASGPQLMDDTTGFSLSKDYGTFDEPAKFGGCTQYDIRIPDGGLGYAEIEAGANSGLYGTASVTFEVELWTDEWHAISFPNSNANVSTDGLRTPAELAGIHPENWSDQERQLLQVERIPSSQQEGQRFDELGLSQEQNSELREQETAVYYCHNPPVGVETVGKGSTDESEAV